MLQLTISLSPHYRSQNRKVSSGVFFFLSFYFQMHESKKIDIVPQRLGTKFKKKKNWKLCCRSICVYVCQCTYGFSVFNYFIYGTFDSINNFASHQKKHSFPKFVIDNSHSHLGLHVMPCHISHFFFIRGFCIYVKQMNYIFNDFQVFGCVCFFFCSWNQPMTCRWLQTVVITWYNC